MSDYQLEFPASATIAEDLKQLGNQLALAVGSAVGSAAKVLLQKAEFNEENFSQEIFVTTPQGKLDVMLLWDKDDGKANVTVGTGATFSGVFGYLPLIVALVAAILADQTPELLPVLRGIRVVLGAIVGLTAGFLLVGALGTLFAVKKPRVDPALEQKVQSAVRRVLFERGATPA
ncbi:MAG TPA: hypothetical protein VM686_28005 [Polyangiaceae bacterium]|nr:hypothetical protein [Polyangiaceae bacterium]